MSDLAVFYEHPKWFEPLWAALERRGVSFEAIQAAGHVYDPAGSPPPAPVVLNRIGMSSFMREPEHPIFYAQSLFAHWELQGARVVNGPALAADTSKARQLSIISSLGLGAPRTRAAHRLADIPLAAGWAGARYRLEHAIVEPKPVRKPPVWAGGESDAAKTVIAEQCDAYVMHGDPPEVIAGKIADMRERRERANKPPLKFGMAGYAVVLDSEAEARRELERITTVPGLAEGTPPPGFANFDQWISGTELERELRVQEYSVSNRGLRPNLIGTPEQVRQRIADYEGVGLDLVLLQMSPQAEKMERFAAQVIRAT